MQLTRVLAATAATAALVLAPAAAIADSNTHADATGDVVSVKAPNTITAQPAQVRGDITSIRVSHLKRSVQVVVRFRDLSPSGDGAGHYFALKSNKTVRYVDVEAGAGMWRGDQTVYNAKNKKTSCRGLTHRIDYTANTVTLRMPSSCLGSNLRWVRAAEYSIVSENGTVFADDARTTGFIDGTFYGPKVRR